jgi:hypothetical protein
MVTKCSKNIVFSCSSPLLPPHIFLFTSPDGYHLFLLFSLFSSIIQWLHVPILTVLLIIFSGSEGARSR